MKDQERVARGFRASLFLIVVFFATATFAADKQRVDFAVVCEDAEAGELITAAIQKEFAAHPELEISESHPLAKLFVYAQQDVNDRVNTNGWSFAVAHVSNRATDVVAVKLLDSTAPEVEEVQPLLISMVREQGFLHHLNVAHLDGLDDETLQTLAKRLVDDFTERASHGGSDESQDD